VTALVGTVTTSAAVPTTTSTAVVPPLGSARPVSSSVTTTGYVVELPEASGSCPIRVTRPGSGSSAPAGVTCAV